MEDKGHIKYYNTLGKEVPSVTTVLKLYGKDLTGWANWLGKLGIDSKTYVDNRAKIGTYIHGLAEKYFNNDKSVLIPKEVIIDKKENIIFTKDDHENLLRRLNYMNNILAQKGFKHYGSEIVMEGSKYGGTADILFHNDKSGKYMLLDFKTSSAIYKTMFIQLAGYTQLLKETKNIDVDVVGIVLITRDIYDNKFFNLKTKEANDRNEEIFNKLLDIYYLHDDSEKRNIK